MKKKILLIAGVGCVMCAGAATTAKSYIQDGLVSHWDGIENAGYGVHDNSATVWTDLTGFCNLEVVDNRSSWMENSFLPPQESYSVAAKDNGETQKIYLSTYVSADVCITRKGVSSNGGKTGVRCVLGLWQRAISWQSGGFISHQSKNTCPIQLEDDVPYSIYAEYNPSGSAVITNYIDAVPIAEVESEYQELYTDNRFQIGRESNIYWSSIAPVNSVRLYNRPLEEWEIEFNSNIDKIRFRGVDGATLSWPEGISYVNNSICYEVSANTKTYSSIEGNDNKIKVDNDTSSSSLTAYKPLEGELTLIPDPDENHKFAMWVGDIDGLEIAEDGSLALDNKVRSVTCVFVPKESSTESREWTNAAGDGDWMNGANWSPEGTPENYDILTIPSGMTAVIGTDADTPSYLAVECAGTLVLSNWNTRLVSISSVKIPNGGVLTCASAIISGEPDVVESYAEQTFSRVNVLCEDLIVEEGGMIDLRLKGWLGAPSTIHCRGNGPGSTTGTFGSAHGGHGGGSTGNAGNGTLKVPSMPYDDPAAPVQPGSSGASFKNTHNSNPGSSGGGVLRVVASGKIKVDGIITADGENAYGYGNSTWGDFGSKYTQAASGGSIYLTCSEISGSGVISANGGGGDSYFNYNPGCSAGGGCIAIYYDPDVQKQESVKGMKITAAAGDYYCKKSSTQEEFKPGAVGETGRANADIGTLRFTDQKLIDELLGNGLSGQIAGVTPYTYNGNLDFNFGHVRFADTGVVVTVEGNLNMNGSDSRLEIGGCEAKWRSVHVDIYGGTNVNKLTVNGDLTLDGVSRLDIRSAETNGVDKFGAIVKVTGTMTISSNCYVYSWSDIFNTGSPHFELGNLNVHTGAVFSATRRGGAGSYNTIYWVYGDSTGKNGNGYNSIGGGHGGLGGLATATKGQTSDDLERPSMVGAGGGTFSNYSFAGAGGGIVFVSATNGTIRVDGTVEADGEGATSYAAGGAGGTVLLEAKKLFVGETGVIRAAGGTATPAEKYATGGGGGGRIALYCGEPWSETLPRSRTIRSFTPFASETYPDNFLFSGTVDASGGTLLGSYTENGSAPGEDGTVIFCHVNKERSLIVIIR